MKSGPVSIRWLDAALQKRRYHLLRRAFVCDEHVDRIGWADQPFGNNAELAVVGDCNLALRLPHHTGVDFGFL